MAKGYRKAKSKQIAEHRTWMLLAFSASSLFMILFVARYSLYGTTAFRGSGVSLWFYRIVFYAHEPLAVVNVPVVAVALITGMKRSVRMHREIAPAAFRIWFFVSITGLAVFTLLYLGNPG